MLNKQRLIIIVGPTASGKSELAVHIAKRVSGEIISADSRQIYKGLDIGSGKVEGKWEERNGKQIFVYKNIPHYLIDEASPRRQYSVAQFQKKAQVVINQIIARGKVPILCGGSGHWIDAVVFGQALPAVKPDPKLRGKLSKLSVDALFKKIEQLDPARATSIDRHNPRRLVRALEIIMTTGKPVPQLKQQSLYKTTWIGLRPDQTTLEDKIKKRLKGWFKQGMLQEVEQLHAAGVSWKRLESFGLEYKYCALLLQRKIKPAEAESLIFITLRQYAKRQITWWKRNAAIHWYADAKLALNEALSILTRP